MGRRGLPGSGQEKVYGKGAAPLALRLFVESLLALKVKDGAAASCSRSSSETC